MRKLYQKISHDACLCTKMSWGTAVVGTANQYMATGQHAHVITAGIRSDDSILFIIRTFYVTRLMHVIDLVYLFLNVGSNRLLCGLQVS